MSVPAATISLRRRDVSRALTAASRPSSAMGFYGDGYFRAHSGGGHLLIGGALCPIRGRVTMDQIVVDVTRGPARARRR